MSPRIPDRVLAAHPAATATPRGHTTAEIAALVTLLRTDRPVTITIGHGRHPTSRATARALADAWLDTAGRVLDAVDWPAQAASWLKPAREMIAGGPDAWVIADTPAGCAQIALRLAEHEGWSARRTFGSASLDHPDTVALAPFGVLTGMRGAGRDGATWRIGHGLLVRSSADGEPVLS